ncbi:MAG TPA: hypothetical protein VIH93_12380, partial [Thermoanaerobaculia bacterium]
DRCLDARCSSTAPVGQQLVSWNLVSPFLSWDDAGATPSRTDPGLSYFSHVAADARAANTCSGWEANDDGALDAYRGYDLRWLTGSADPRGPEFSVGDLIPLDWTASHQQALLDRLAPNHILDPAALPDFQVAPYLQDQRAPGETFLRLKDERARPLIPTGKNPIAASLQAFRAWYAGCPSGICPPGAGWSGVAAVEDPGFACRSVNLLVVAGRGDDTCGGGDQACALAGELHDRFGVKTYVLSFATPLAPGSLLTCLAANGGTGSPIFPQSVEQLIQAFRIILGAKP